MSQSAHTRTTDVQMLVIASGVAAALWWLGRGMLSTPPIDSWQAYRDWLAGQSTAVAAIATLRAAACVIAGYLAAVSALATIGRAARSASLQRLSRALTPTTLRPLLGVAMSASIATSAISVTVPRTAAHELATTLLAPSDATATMVAVGRSTTTTTATTTSRPASTTTATTTTAPPSSAIVPATLPAPAAEPSSAQQPAAPHDEWIIQPGEHLWFVAHETLSDAWGREPTDTEVAPYWRDLIERNRSRLIDPSNPDYVMPNQSFSLPPVPAAPAR